MSTGVLYKIIKWCVAATIGFWVNLPSVVQALVLLIGLDFATGLIAGFAEKKLASNISYKGLARKVLMLLLVTMAHLIDKFMNVGVPIGNAVAVAYCINEVISITENCGKVGVPIPRILIDSMAKLKELQTSGLPPAK